MTRKELVERSIALGLPLLMRATSEAILLLLLLEIIASRSGSCKNVKIIICRVVVVVLGCLISTILYKWSLVLLPLRGFLF
jgi:hypothetical protein